jgi:hypothetical protein
MKVVKSRKQFEWFLERGFVEVDELGSDPVIHADYQVLPRIEKLPGIWIKEVPTPLSISVDYGIFEEVFPEHCYQSTTIALCVTKGICAVMYDYGREAVLSSGSTLVIPPGVYFKIIPVGKVELFVVCTPAWDGADVENFA